MADDDRPTPPPELEDSVRATLEEVAKRDPSQLPAVAAYVEDLAAWIESGGGADGDGSDAGDSEGNADAAARDTESADYPAGVPERASVTVTEIGGTEYRYYQWRDGDEIRSKTVER